ncbi:antibiotic biosynthesis monooxygenase [Thiohalophilus sp.]|uniref:antibiotic biosynthesis monooxygenase family protein n=1 Tax=Thiohalophilus sp. TaxID=3028392 RepID=UPI002ACEC693|nr:antibiotic biosynthesis monooxygenase [Thiohalophilus sp.]MDZ7663552.1 antibiotic biosynthesis monooxygenase [Thiohalophilus sp.]
MIAVIFEVIPTAEGKQEYLSIAAQLREYLKEMPGFISVERFQSLSDERKILSLSFWEDEEAISRWRNLEQHRVAQTKGRDRLFQDYRIRVGTIVRDYTLNDRAEGMENSERNESG